MKRSKTASLVAMGLAPLALSGCDRSKTSLQEFASIDTCTHAGVPTNSCVTAYGAAEVDAVQSAPNFSAREQCEAQYDPSDCQSYTNNSGVTAWRPNMTGFFVRRVIDSNTTSYYPAGPYFLRRNGTDYSSHWNSALASAGARDSDGWRSIASEGGEAGGDGEGGRRGGFGGGEDGGS